jgi:hypothetical protein
MEKDARFDFTFFKIKNQILALVSQENQLLLGEFTDVSRLLDVVCGRAWECSVSSYITLKFNCTF